MEIMIPCIECALAAQVEGGGFGPEGVEVRNTAVHVQDRNLYRTKCPNGHQLIAILDHNPFELLFESGLEALVDGYFRESVSSFAAALERLYEFSIHVQLTSDKVNVDELEAMWKSVAAQSERQLGMYIGVRTLKDGRQPPMLSSSLTKFRNSVIHKGYFPSNEEAFGFGEAVFRLILDEVLRLDKHCKNAVIDQTNVRRKKTSKSLDKCEIPRFVGFGLAVADRSDRSFGDVVVKVQARMRRRRASESPTVLDVAPSGGEPSVAEE